MLGVAALLGWQMTQDEPSADATIAVVQPPSEAPKTIASKAPETVASVGPAPTALGPPEGPLVDHPKVLRERLPDGGARYVGEAPQQRAAIVMDQTLADSTRWPTLADATRRQLARRIDWDTVMVDAAGAVVKAPPNARFAIVARRPAATLLSDGDAAPIVTGEACGDLAEGDRVFTLQWTILGYGGGRCEGHDCVDALARALRSSRHKGERLDLRFTVLRGEDDQRETIRCSVRG